MANKSKDIGTKAETAVVRAARTRGFPHADRITLSGHKDRSDVRLTLGLTAGIVVQVKGGQYAKTASDQQIANWLHETETGRVNAGAAIALLVTQRTGIGLPNAHRWWAHLTVHTFLTLLGATHAITPPNPDAALRMTLDSALALLRAAGYGNQHDQEATA